MFIADRNSELSLRSIDPREAVAPGQWDQLPVLDITSDHTTTVDPRHLPRARSPHFAPSPDPTSYQDSSFWLDADVVLCACPNCSAPMTVRLWLMVADCWRCGLSIELTEEQEGEAIRLLEHRERWRQDQSPNQPVVPPKTLSAAAASWPMTSTPTAPPRQEIDRPLEKTPTAKPLQDEHIHTADSVNEDKGAPVRVGDLFHDMPAWLVSLIFHLLLLTLLALITLDRKEPARYITLSNAVGQPTREGDAPAWLSPEGLRFDLPVPEKDRPRNDRQLRAMIRADQEARQLRIDPNSSDPNLPDLNRVKRDIGSPDGTRRSLATRDPRVRAELLQREGGTTLTEAAVARGLAWLAKHQDTDGSWSLDRFHRHPSCRGRCKGRGNIDSDAAATSLALLPYLGAGQTHLTGHYKDVVSAGLRWLMDNQRDDGDLRAGAPNHAGMYVHGQGAIVLCEALAMTRDETFRKPAQLAVDFVVAAQHRRGGWRYKPCQPGDTSVLGWQLMALQSARSAGLDVPRETMESASYFLDSVQSHDGSRYAYQARNRPTPAMTAEALLCRVYLGWKGDNTRLIDGTRFLLDEHPPRYRDPNFYYWYYATQVMHHLGGQPWQDWNLSMRDVLVASQETDGHQAGSWDPRGGHSRQGGRLYVTALAVCCLEVYYRHAPIFRPIDLD